MKPTTESGPERPPITVLLLTVELVDYLLGFVGVVRYRTDRMITAAFEASFVVLSWFRGKTKHYRNGESNNTAQPGMRGVTG